MGITATGFLGCTTWSTLADVAEPIPERKKYRIWADDEQLVVHSLRIEGDSLSAVPHWQPPDCRDCRVHWATAEVDSLEIGEFSPGRTVLLMSGIAAGLVLLGYLLPWPQEGS